MKDPPGKQTEDDMQTDCPLTKKRKLHTDEFSQPWSLPVDVEIPPPGLAVDRQQFRRAGPYTIGTEVVGYRPVRSIVQFIGKKENSDKFYQLKIVQLSRRSESQERSSQDEQRGKILLHTEYSLLSLLQNEPGVIKHHGMFSDLAFEETLTRKQKPTYTGAVMKRLILVLDCLIQHPFCDKSAAFISLQEHIMTVKKFDENEAIYVFYELAKIVENIHKRNIVHRDLKLGNIVLNKSSKKIILTNFCLGRYLSNENMLFYDQVGSPAYISPDVISGNPYKGKPSDMWALGVIYFIMLFGNFPFFKSSSAELFAQIQTGSFEIPQDTSVSPNSIDVIKRLLCVDPEKRMTAAQLRSQLESLMALKNVMTPDQRVPFDESRMRNYINFNHIGKAQIDEQVVPNSIMDKNQATAKSSTTSGSVLEKLKENMLRSMKTRGLKRPNLHKPNCLLNNGITFSYTLANAEQANGLTIHVTSRQPQSRLNSCIRMPQNAGRPSTVRNSRSMIRDFVSAIDQYFSSGRMLAPNGHHLIDFNGILSQTLASRLYRWITNEFSSNALVRHVLLESDANIINRVKSLLAYCGIRMEITIFGPQILRNQSNHVLFLLTCMLKGAGYNNTYFLPQLEL